MPKELPILKKEQAPISINLGDESDDAMSFDEALSRVALILAETRTPKLLTEVDDEEIRLCAALYATSENLAMFDVTQEKMIQSFLLNFLQLRVSNKRLGRRELLEVAKAAKDIPEQRFSRLKSLFGGKQGM
jgi:3-polyprenyl-4-hydroxybenzoate decarboxylase